MAFLIAKKPLNSPSYPYHEDDEEERPRPQSSVTSCIYLKPDAGGGAAVRQSLDKEVVLRRIRQRKRVNRIRTAIQSLLRASPEELGGSLSGWWLDDAFSAP